MPVERREIEGNLPGKGFAQEETHHRYFYHEVDGKRTGPYTYTSRGSAYKVYGPDLLARMKKELKLDTIGEVADLCTCPMTGTQYTKKLREKGALPKLEKQAPPREKRPPRKKRRR